MCSELTIKTPEPLQWRLSAVFTVNFEHISHLVLVGFFVNFEQVNAGWEISFHGNYFGSILSGNLVPNLGKFSRILLC